MVDNSHRPIYPLPGSPCPLRRYESLTPVSLSAWVYINDDDANAGGVSCKSKVGEPVNVTNGNMYLQQTDY